MAAVGIGCVLCTNHAYRCNAMQRPAHLVLEDGTVFPGVSVGAPGVAAGEACFTTAMTGYEEAVTDPSYVAQVLCFSYPLIGTYGVDEPRMESGPRAVRGRRDARRAARVRGLAARAGASSRSTGVDTRTLVRKIRDGGVAALRARRRRRSRSCTRARSPSRRSTAARSTASVGAERAVLASAPARGSSSSTSARSARSRAGSPRPGSRPTSSRAPGTPTRSSRPTPRAVLIAQRPRRPGRAHRPGRDDPRPARPRAALRRLPRPPAARARARPRDLQAPVRPPRREPSRCATSRPAACSSPCRTTASRSIADERRLARLAQRRHLRGPRRRRLRERPVPSRGVARARSTRCPSSTAWPTTCRSAPTFARS